MLLEPSEQAGPKPEGLLTMTCIYCDQPCLDADPLCIAHRSVEDAKQYAECLRSLHGLLYFGHKRRPERTTLDQAA